MTHVHILVFPDGLKQDMETGLNVQEGALLSSEQLGITSEPSGKYIVKSIEDVDSGQIPVTRYYHLQKF
jgi:hypothetical protein